MVVTSAPSACTASTVHDFTACPSRWTVQAPQLEVSHPTWVPVRPSSSRSAWTSNNRGSTCRFSSLPLTVKRTFTVLLIALLRTDRRAEADDTPRNPDDHSD